MTVIGHCSMLSNSSSCPYLASQTKKTWPTTLPPRIMKKTLTTEFAGDVTPLISEYGTNLISYKNGLRSLLSSLVLETIQKQAVNLVLGELALEINCTKRSHSRKTRSTLAQLHSGYSLYSYLLKINPAKYPTPNALTVSPTQHPICSTVLKTPFT